MRLRFSRRTDYALRAALQLAAQSEGLTKRSQLAAAIDAPSGVVAQALADLVRAGLVIAVAGRKGGYRLARPPAEISVLEVVHAIEPPGAPARCVLHERVCSWEGACPLHATVAEAEQAYLARLAATSLADVAPGVPLAGV
jgi:Rrf2 family protein